MKRIFASVLLCAMLFTTLAIGGAGNVATPSVLDADTYPQIDTMIGNVGGSGEVTVDTGVFTEVTGYGSVPTVGKTYSKYAGSGSEPINNDNGDFDAWWETLGETGENIITIDTAQELLLFFWGIQNATTSHTDITYAGITVKLTKDIIINEVNDDGSLKTSYAGTNIASGNTFNGVFEGNGHVVQGYYINASSNGKAIFSALNGATVRNVAFIDAYTDAYWEAHEKSYTSNGKSTVGPQKQASLLARTSAGTTLIENVYVGGKIDGSKAGTGGLIGSAGGTLTVKNVTVDVEFGAGGHNPAEYYIGGMIGQVTGTLKATNCLVNCDLTVDAGLNAAVVTGGTCTKLNQTNEEDTGLPDGQGRDMYLVDETSFDFTTACGYGGLVGYASGTLTLQNCKTTGSIAAAGRGIGGIVGQLNTTTSGRTHNFTNCQSEMTLTTLDTIYVPFSIGSDDKAYYVNTGSETEPVYERAFFDNMQSKTVTYAKGAEVNGTTLGSAQTVNAFEGVGGIVGENKGSTGTVNFKSVWYSGTVDAGNRNFVGGILGAQTGKTAVNFSSSNVTTFSCINTGSITANGSYVGGILGGLWKFQAINLNFYNCLNGTNSTNGSVSGKNNIGGILGYVYSNSKATLVNCQNTGSVSGKEMVGGLIGQRSGGVTSDITNCNNYGAISGTGTDSQQIGGLLGYKGNTGTMTFTDCNNYAEVKGKNYIGGILGYMTQGAMYFNNCTNTANITGTGSNVGGIAAYTAGSASDTNDKNIVLDGCLNTGNISGSSSVGGLVGSKAQASPLTIKNSKNEGDVNGSSHYVGGIIGQAGAETTDGVIKIQDSTNEGTVTGLSRNGGIVGYTQTSSISLDNCVNTGAIQPRQMKVDSDSGAWVGGIIGYAVGKYGDLLDSVSITNCRNLGSITGNRCTGGLVGYAQYVARFTLANCYSMGDINVTVLQSSNPYCGGLVGQIGDSGEATVTGNTFGGTLTVNANTSANPGILAGGLVGNVRRPAKNGNNVIDYVGEGLDATFGNFLFINNTVNADGIKQGTLTFSGEKAGSLKRDALCGGNGSTSTLTPEFELNTIVSSTGKLPTDVTCFSDDPAAKIFAKRMIMKIGTQYYHNTDNDTYDLRYVFAIDKLQENDVALGFKLERFIFDKDGNGSPRVTSKTLYCPNVYKKLNGETKTYSVEDYGAEYFFTLELKGIPSAEVELVDGRYMLKNSHLNITPFISTGDLANGGKVLGEISHTDSIAYANRQQFYQNDFKTSLPDAFDSTKTDKVVAELIPDDIRWHSDTLLNQKDGENYVYANGDIMDYGCLDVKKVNNTTAATLISNCTNETEGHMCTPFDAYAVTALLTNSNTTARYHYYVEKSSVAGSDSNTAYMRFFVDTTKLNGAGVYDFCFQLRLKDNLSRYARVQINDQPYHEQKVLSYNPAVYTNVITSNTVADATYQDSYLPGFSAELKEGVNTITIRLPYYQNSVTIGNTWHLRNIFVVKAAE